MTVYWLPIDKYEGHATYEELKDRKVVAQGWSAIGDLSGLCNITDKQVFYAQIQMMGDQAYGNVDWWLKDREEATPRSMWHLLIEAKSGDIFVGKEGKNIRGICQIERDGLVSYRYDSDYEYAQNIGFPVEWIDWDESIFGHPPNPPAMMRGVKRLQTEYERLIDCWNLYLAKR